MNSMLITLSLVGLHMVSLSTALDLPFGQWKPLGTLSHEVNFLRKLVQKDQVTPDGTEEQNLGRDRLRCEQNNQNTGTHCK